MPVFKPTVVSLLLIVLLLSVAACGGSDNIPVESAFPSSNLTQAEVDALHELAEQLDKDGNLKPAMPLYLPAGLERLPSGSGGSRGGSTLVFMEDVAGHNPVGGPTARDLVLAQTGPEAAVIDPGPFIDLNGVRASEQSGRQDDDSFFYALSFRIDDRNFFLDVAWVSPEGGLTDEMKMETAMVAQSVIADARTLGLVNNTAQAIPSGQEFTFPPIFASCSEALPPLSDQPITPAEFEFVDSAFAKMEAATSSADLESTFFGRPHNFTHNIDQRLRPVDSALATVLCLSVVELEDSMARGEGLAVTRDQVTELRELVQLAAEEVGLDE